MYFTWSENINALSLSITFDIRFPETKLNMAYELLGLINENLWIGHFDITSKKPRKIPHKNGAKATIFGI